MEKDLPHWQAVKELDSLLTNHFRKQQKELETLLNQTSQAQFLNSNLTMQFGSSFLEITQASLAELNDLSFHDYPFRELNFYRDTLIAFFSNDLVRLENHASWINGNFAIDQENMGTLEALQVILPLRVQIRQREIQSSSIEQAISCFDSLDQQNSIWCGELSFLIGKCFEIKKCYKDGHDFYRDAVQHFKRIGADHKALRAQFNAISCENNFHAESNPKRYIISYHSVLHKAKKMNNSYVMGLCLLNIALEYQNLKMLPLALNYVSRAIDAFEGEFGSQIYFHALGIRCHIYAQMGRLREAEADDAILSTSSHPEIRAVRSVIHQTFTKARTGKLEESLLATPWVERHTQAHFKNNKQVLGELESRLLELLSQQPLTKHDLIPQLYDTRIEYPVLENRFKSLMRRLRKKCPNLIICENDTYRLCDNYDSQWGVS